MENVECPRCSDGEVMLKDYRMYREETRKVRGMKGTVIGIWWEWQRCQKCNYQVLFTTEGEVIQCH